jgi:6-phosphogluconolactonase
MSPTGARPQVLVYADADAVAEATGVRLLLAAADAVALRGRADIVLTGGTVGIELLRRAAAAPLARLVDWTSVHVWWGDERFVPAGDLDRNEGQAQEALLASLPMPEDNIHRMGASTAFSTAEEAAAAYSEEISRRGGASWDVALFGMGPDGHVASLFPGHQAFEESLAQPTGGPDAVAVHGSPKPPPTRVSLRLSAINRAREVWIVAAGAEKAPAVAQALSSTHELAGDTTIPAAHVHGVERTLWLIDAAAATRI